jgi:phage repressor protein C with HTH and peptisase S24 domain
MHKRIKIGSRLKELRKKYKFSQQYVAEQLFISQAAYSLIENSQNGIVAEHIVGLSNLYEVTTDYILKGDKQLLRVSPTQGFIPYVRINAHAGFVKNSSGELGFEDQEWYRIPGYNPTQDHLLFEVEGDSMVPTVLQGDVVICQKQNNWKTILDGSIVVVVTKDSVMVKRLRREENNGSFTFENDNPEQEKVVKKDYQAIKDIYMVRGKISNVLIPHHQMTSKGKIQSLEDSIEYLKKELYNINKKLNSIRK